MLAHYATLGDDLKNATKLQAYFDRLKKRRAVGDRLRRGFGVHIDGLWQTTLIALYEAHALRHGTVSSQRP